MEKINNTFRLSIHENKYSQERLISIYNLQQFFTRNFPELKLGIALFGSLSKGRNLGSECGDECLSSDIDAEIFINFVGINPEEVKEKLIQLTTYSSRAYELAEKFERQTGDIRDFIKMCIEEYFKDKLLKNENLGLNETDVDSITCNYLDDENTSQIKLREYDVKSFIKHGFDEEFCSNFYFHEIYLFSTMDVGGGNRERILNVLKKVKKLIISKEKTLKSFILRKVKRKNFETGIREKWDNFTLAIRESAYRNERGARETKVGIDKYSSLDSTKLGRNYPKNFSQLLARYNISEDEI